MIGSADVWNNELDRIRYFHDRYRTSVEEMETASAAQIVAEFKVPFVGIRVLSNNHPKASTIANRLACEDYVYQVVKAYIANLKKH